MTDTDKMCEPTKHEFSVRALETWQTLSTAADHHVPYVLNYGREFVVCKKCGAVIQPSDLTNTPARSAMRSFTA